MDKKINIAQVIYGLKYGGAEKLLIPLSTKVDSERFRVMVIALTCGGPVERELRRLDVEVRVLRRDGKFRLFDLLRLIRLIKKEKVDIVHTHLQNADLWAGFAARLCGIKHISTFHGTYYKKAPLEFLKQRLRVILPDNIIAVSHAIAKYCTEQLKAKEEKIIVIYNGVDFDRFQVSGETNLKRREMGIPVNATVLGSFGRLEIEKGYYYFIEAVSHLKANYPKTNSNLIVLIVGEGSLRQKLMQKAVELGVKDEVKFLGERSDVPQLLQITDIVVIPSLSEGLSIVALEAMAAGKPLIATNVGGMPELITSGSDGLLVSPCDASALSCAILTLMENKDLAYRLASAAKEKLAKNFSEESMLTKIMQAYEELL